MLTIKILSVLCGVAFLCWNRGIAPQFMLDWSEKRRIRLSVGRMNAKEIRDKLLHAYKRSNMNPLTARVEVEKVKQIIKKYGLEHDKIALKSLSDSKALALRITFNHAHEIRERSMVGETRAARALTVPPPPVQRAIPVDAHDQHVNLDLDAPFTLGLPARMRRAG